MYAQAEGLNRDVSKELFERYDKIKREEALLKIQEEEILII